VVGRLGAMNTAVGPVQDPASPAHRVPPRPKRQLVLHPILFGAFPVLYLFAQNVHEGLGWSDVLAPLLVCVAAATIVMAVCWLALRDARRAGLITSAFVVLFFSYGHVYQALGGRRVAGFVVGRQALLLPLWAILAAAAVVLAVRLGGRSAALTFGLNLIAAGLVMVNLVQIVVAQAAAPGEVHPAGFDAARPAWHPLPGVTKPPDIYYIVLDEYAGPTTLQDQFGFDDGPFLRALSLRGFDVEPDAHTNYPRTLALARVDAQHDLPGFPDPAVRRGHGGRATAPRPHPQLRGGPVAEAGGVFVRAHRSELAADVEEPPGRRGGAVRRAVRVLDGPVPQHAARTGRPPPAPPAEAAGRPPQRVVGGPGAVRRPRLGPFADRRAGATVRLRPPPGPARPVRVRRARTLP